MATSGRTIEGPGGTGGMDGSPGSVIAGQLEHLPPRVAAAARTLAAFDTRAIVLWAPDDAAYGADVRACSCDGALSERNHGTFLDLLGGSIDLLWPEFEGHRREQSAQPPPAASWARVPWRAGGVRGLFWLAPELAPEALATRRAWLEDALAPPAGAADPLAGVETLADGLIVAGLDGRVRSITLGAAAALGVTASEAVGRDLDELTPAAITTRLAAIEPAEIIRLRVERADGRGDEVLTARREPEPDATVVATLSPAARSAGRAARLDQLVAALRHELRTPLTVLRGVSSMLEEEPDMDLTDRVGFLRSLRRETQRVIVLVEDLLTLARLDSGAPLTRRGPVDLAAWADDLVAEAEPWCAAQGVALRRELAAAAAIDADRALLDQLGRSVLGHVLRDATAGLAITARVVADGAEARFELDDDGPEPAGDHADGPFTAFKRSTSAGKHAPGVGVGLHLAKKIADAHGFELRVERRDGLNRIVLRAPRARPSAEVRP